MYNFLDPKEVPNISTICSCGRKYLIEEMYACGNCQIAMCRYCSVEEIQNCYCPNCLEITLYSSDKIYDACRRCVNCPVCTVNLSLLATSGKDSKSMVIYYQCNFCLWDSRKINLAETNFDNLQDKKYIEQIDLKSKAVAKIAKYYKDAFKNIEADKSKFDSFKKEYKTLKIKTSAGRGKIEKTPWTIKDTEDRIIEQQTKTFAEMTILNYELLDSIPLFKPRTSDQELNEMFKDLSDESFPSFDEFLNKKEDFNNYCTMAKLISHPKIYKSTLDTMHPDFKKNASRRGRKCRKCLKKILKPQQENRGLAVTFQLCALLSDNFPRVTIRRISEIGADGKCIVEIRVFNKTKIDFKLNASPLSTELSVKDTYNQIEFVGATEINLASTYAIEEKKQGQELKGIFSIKVQIDKDRPETKFGFTIVSHLENLALVFTVPLVIDLGIIKKE